jgi:hypothetical protein
MAALLGLAVVLVSGCQRLAERPGAPTLVMDASLFTRDQPSVLRVFEWDGKVVAECLGQEVSEPRHWYLLELGSGVAVRVALPGAEAIIGLADRGPSGAVALCRSQGDLFLLTREGEGWLRLELPEAVRPASDPPVLCADAASVVLLGEKEACWRKGEVWQPVAAWKRKVPSALEGMSSGPDCVLAAGETLFLGYDRGEWGGGLLALDVRSGDQREVNLGAVVYPSGT